MNVKLVEEILSKPAKLSPDQKEAVLSRSRYNRVIAGAGAVKTETLTMRIVYLILADGVEPSSIVAFTFTERAAQAMKSRIYQRVGELASGKLGWVRCMLGLFLRMLRGFLMIILSLGITLFWMRIKRLLF